jgi:2-oxoglutarate dehydrogenase E1 component
VLASRQFIEALYEDWRSDPSSVAEQWQHFFQGFELALSTEGDAAGTQGRKQSQVASLIYAYRDIGHLVAQLDPLGSSPQHNPLLELGSFGLDESDLDQLFDTGHLSGIAQRATLREILAMLQETYCGAIGVEYLHIQDTRIRRWLQKEMEPHHNRPSYSTGRKFEALDLLTDAELFETFIQSRYPGHKRFSLEGAESLIPALHAIVEMAPDLGAEELVLGMAHRGRLNVLTNILDKPYEVLFSEFEDVTLPDMYGGDGDVKYHRGFSSDHVNRNGRSLHIALVANPSHLEAVDPVVEGKARAKQRRREDTEERRRVLPMLIHGDAAFAGQGLAAETINLSQLEGYRTGGTIHFVINNQIGFTTSPEEARSTRYATDVAKMVEAPILHVNGDDPEAVMLVSELALRFRQELGRDVVVDMVCYRRHGHNEGDEPAFTQPLLYEKIRKRPPVRLLYKKRLVDGGLLSDEDSERRGADFKERLEKAFETVKVQCPLPDPNEHAYGGLWQELDNPFSHEPVETGVEQERLIEVASALTTVPEEFTLNRKVARQLSRQAKSVDTGGNVLWPTAELLAFGTLLTEGLPVRLSGQDSERGTFSQRHAVWHDMKTQQAYIPLNHIRDGQARFCVYNSMLSEAAVLGFDYGYSLTEPDMLVLWEAQFGDFANGAQVIIDNFITPARDKWQRSSGLVMLLPHGFEGQGPEHSNAYLERYLAACAEDNIQVAYPSTSAQYFHLLRRQLKRPFRLPLIVMTPKSMLRAAEAASPVEELVSGRFNEILDDPAPPRRPRRLVLGSGKLFWELQAARDEAGAAAALVRIEQLYPFHESLAREVVQRYPGVEEVVWAQEEPQNRGAWSYIQPLLAELASGTPVRYAGRVASASPATGSLRVHKQEQEELIRSALGIS